MAKHFKGHLNRSRKTKRPRLGGGAAAAPTNYSGIVLENYTTDELVKLKDRLPEGYEFALIEKPRGKVSARRIGIPGHRAWKHGPAGDPLKGLKRVVVRGYRVLHDQSQETETRSSPEEVRMQAVRAGRRLAEEALAASGGAYSLEQVQELLHNVTRQAVEKRVRDGSVFTVSGESGRRKYPVVQFTNDGEVVPGIKAVREALGTTNPLMLLTFLVAGDAGQRPIDLLQAGKVEEAVKAAATFGMQGA
jgi:hypothetical protein